jgi:hypothetical protein
VTSLLAIDPGAAHPGPACAYFDDTRLVHVEFSYTPSFAVDHVVIERPEYQGARSQAARVQDLLALSWAGAKCAYIAVGRGATPHEYTPSARTGQEPKPVHHSRLWAVLDTNERRVLGGDATARAIEAALDAGARRRWPAGYAAYPRSFKTHNLLDAAALGAFFLGRLEKR